MIDDSTDAVLAKYGAPEKRGYLLIIQYKDTNSASGAYGNFLENYFPEKQQVNVLKLEDNTWMTAGLLNNIFFGIFNGESEEFVTGLLSEVKLNYKNIINSKHIINP
jgi:hypothetical protein